VGGGDIADEESKEGAVRIRRIEVAGRIIEGILPLVCHSKGAEIG
jgi:hypothetical protein